ncbi:MAG TPA: Txe/YoeB family addiction module toxin, partial [Thermoanaerobaculia bacterium]|nr:Txe/YoeB family addiction module toxin [Thermoanaerobaculia bacterium]
RAIDLIEAIIREPFTGIGKPEPLKYLADGAWSRRLTQEHRVVYLVKSLGVAGIAAADPVGVGEHGHDQLADVGADSP